MIFSLSNIKDPCRQAVKFSAFTFFTPIFFPSFCHSHCIPGVNSTDSFSSPTADTFTFPVNRVVNTRSSLSYAFILKEVPNTRVRTSFVSTTKGCAASGSTSKYASPFSLTTRSFPIKSTGKSNSDSAFNHTLVPSLRIKK